MDGCIDQELFYLSRMDVLIKDGTLMPKVVRTGTLVPVKDLPTAANLQHTTRPGLSTGHNRYLAFFGGSLPS
jgi:hypothetical protein